MSKVALVTGVTGQDGSYLAEQLLDDGWEVIGLVRDMQADAGRLTSKLKNRLRLERWKIPDADEFLDHLLKYKPQAIYNLAGASSGAGMFDDPVSLMGINGIAVACILESIRVSGLATRFCQASSSEMFGAAKVSPQTEGVPFEPRSPYGAAKLYGHNMVSIYRSRFGVFACSVILYNHESPRRGADFVTSKIARAAARISLGLQDQLLLGDIDAVRDWGYAPDYVRAMRLTLEHSAPDDFVIATGTGRKVSQFCDAAFQHVGLDFRDFIATAPHLVRAPESVALIGNAEKARRLLNWSPQTTFKLMVEEMVDAELERIR